MLQVALAMRLKPIVGAHAVTLVPPAFVLQDPSKHLEVCLRLVLNHVGITEAALVAEGSRPICTEASELAAAVGSDALPFPHREVACLLVVVAPLPTPLRRLQRGCCRRRGLPWNGA